MDLAEKQNGFVPKWVQWAFKHPWYLWIGWLLESGLLFVFLSVTYTQYAEDEARAGWVMILLTLIFCGPGLWVLLGYKPQVGSRFGKYDIGLLVCFALWIGLLGYALLWDVQFYQSPFGTPHVTGAKE